MARTKPRKWIANQIEQLDPIKDYAEIWKLSLIYRVNGAFLDLIYAITFPHFIVPNHGSLAVLRQGKGKVYTNPERRMDDTARHLLIWSEYGPDHEFTRKSIDAINKMHAFYAKQYPGSFSHVEDYIYTLCFEATLFHRLLLRVGMKGFTEKQKIASWKFCSRLAELFVVAEDGSPIRGFPESFEGCMAYCENYEKTKRPPNIYAEEIDKVILQGFGNRHAPKFLRPLARALVISLISDDTVRELGIRQPSVATKKLLRFAFRCFLWMGEHVIPDPDVSYPDLARAQLRLPAEKYAGEVSTGIPYGLNESTPGRN